MSALHFALVVGVALSMLGILVLSLWYVRCDRMRAFDRVSGTRFAAADSTSPEMAQALTVLRTVRKAVQSVPRGQKLQAVRYQMDRMFASRELDIWCRPVSAGGVPAQWVQAPGSHENRRLLYIHGGGFYAGSTLSHRTITAKLSAITGCAVLAIDYRLMPEHKRMDGIADTRAAYQWMLQNGPGDNYRGVAAQDAYVAGDSAGGNLTLALLLWLRDQRLRMPDAAVALSPVTDKSFRSPSLRSNLATDWILGPMFRQLLRVPRVVLLWVSLYQTRMLPLNPQLSPVYGDLSGLPPVLVQVSESEVLFDDARRFANKAVAAGSPVTLQTWPGMMHVWHIFNPELPQAEQAFEEIAKFLHNTSARKTARQATRAEAPR